MQFDGNRSGADNRSLARRLQKARNEIAVLRRRIAELERVRHGITGAEVGKPGSAEASHSGKYKYDYSAIIGESSAMDNVFRTLDRIIESNIPVLVQGESGTGKELVARAIHFNSLRRGKKFVCENCAAIPEPLLESELFGYLKGAFTGAVCDKTGLLELADGGTLFLDEIGEMSLPMQSKLLRVIQDGEIRPIGGKETKHVDVRIISASNKNLLAEVERGRFRKDLFYRINVITVELPPLRERRDDIPLLVNNFFEKIYAGSGIARKDMKSEVMAMLVAYDWPGNVRELENEIYRLVTLSDSEITPVLLSSHIQRVSFEPSLPDMSKERIGRESLKRAVAKAELAIITEALRRCGGNQTKAAKLLGLSRFGLRKKMMRCGFSKHYSPYLAGVSFKLKMEKEKAAAEECEKKMESGTPNAER